MNGKHDLPIQVLCFTMWEALVLEQVSTLEASVVVVLGCDSTPVFMVGTLRAGSPHAQRMVGVSRCDFKGDGIPLLVFLPSAREMRVFSS